MNFNFRVSKTFNEGRSFIVYDHDDIMTEQWCGVVDMQIIVKINI